jgi:hypothetical protein
MKSQLTILLLSVAMNLLSAEENEVFIQSHAERGKGFEWYISLKNIERLPKWNPLNSSVPLPISPEKAVQIANDWIKTNRNLNFQPEVASIVLRPIHPEKEEWKYCYIYIINFSTGIFHSTDCIVLMDGSILEPRPAKNVPPQKKETN